MRQSILQMDKGEVFDLVEALYAFCILNHGGMFSDIYALQCEVGQEYHAGMGWSESEVEESNQFYHEITEDNARYIWNRVSYYLENRWDDE